MNPCVFVFDVSCFLLLLLGSSGAPWYQELFVYQVSSTLSGIVEGRLDIHVTPLGT